LREERNPDVDDDSTLQRHIQSAPHHDSAELSLSCSETGKENCDGTCPSFATGKTDKEFT